MQKSVFFSYSIKDKHMVGVFEKKLMNFELFCKTIANQDMAINIFLAHGGGINVDDEWNKEIKDSLLKTELFVLFQTTSSISSPYVQNEVGYFLASQDIQKVLSKKLNLKEKKKFLCLELDEVTDSVMYYTRHIVKLSEIEESILPERIMEEIVFQLLEKDFYLILLFKLYQLTYMKMYRSIRDKTNEIYNYGKKHNIKLEQSILDFFYEKLTTREEGNIFLNIPVNNSDNWGIDFIKNKLNELSNQSED